MIDSWYFGAIYCCCRSLVATFMMLSLGARCCCGCRSLAVLAMISLDNLVLFAAAVAVYLLPWCELGTCFCCLCAVYCCCCSLIIAVLVMHSLGKLVLQFTAAAVAVYLLSWRLLDVCFCSCCRLFVVLAILYRVNLVLSAAASIYWLSWSCSVL
ncbi:hypothetical protein MAM1_0083d04605, partial [Mucor ambiguus]